MAMDPYIKRRWVDALRSGRYKQGDLGPGGQGFFQCESGYCCLGVLLRVTGDDRKHLEDVRLGFGDLIDLGLDYGEAVAAADWNDGRHRRGRLSFEQIADRIEAGELDGVPLEAANGDT